MLGSKRKNEYKNQGEETEMSDPFTFTPKNPTWEMLSISVVLGCLMPFPQRETISNREHDHQEYS